MFDFSLPWIWYLIGAVLVLDSLILSWLAGRKERGASDLNALLHDPDAVPGQAKPGPHRTLRLIALGQVLLAVGVLAWAVYRHSLL